MHEPTTDYESFFIEQARDPTFALAYLNEALETGDEALFLTALRQVAKSWGFTRVAERTGVSRQHLYNALSEDGNPSLRTLLPLLKGLDLQFVVKKRAS